MGIGEDGGETKIRNYEEGRDRAQVEDLERRCEVGPAERLFLFTDTMGDAICRIRNSPVYKMLVAEVEKQVVGVIQGSIKVVTVRKPPKNVAKVGYVLGLRVSRLYRRRGIALKLVRRLEEWFVDNGVEYAYMATEMENEASVKLFVERLGYVKFRTPAILVNPVRRRRVGVPSSIEIAKVRVEEAEALYRKFMGSTEFFSQDIDRIVRNRASLGTWVAYPRGGRCGVGVEKANWAMVSVWNSGELFKLRLGKAPLSCLLYAKASRLLDCLLPLSSCIPTIPDFFTPFGFYFIYGVHREGEAEGPLSRKLVRGLCNYVHNLARKTTKDCKVIVTEVGACDTLRHHIPHSNLLSCPEDLWCIKPLKNDHDDFTITPPSTSLFVDPREV